MFQNSTRGFPRVFLRLFIPSYGLALFRSLLVYCRILYLGILCRRMSIFNADYRRNVCLFFIKYYRLSYAGVAKLPKIFAPCMSAKICRFLRLLSGSLFVILFMSECPVCSRVKCKRGRGISVAGVVVFSLFYHVLLISFSRFLSFCLSCASAHKKKQWKTAVPFAKKSAA